jgi:urease accessory protein
MDDTAALIRLMSWLSPVFPIGGFAYSAGLENAIAGHTVTDDLSLEAWLVSQLTCGSAWNDCVFLAEAHRRASGGEHAFDDLVALALALQPAAERHHETIDQGTSFRAAAIHWVDLDNILPEKTPLSICIGSAAGMDGIERRDGLAAYLHAFVTNQLQAAIRLSIIGQSAAASILAQLEDMVAETAQKAAASTLDDLGTSAFMADIAAMNHESLQPRLFKS